MAIEVHLIDIFKGPRHERLKKIWQTIILYCDDLIPRIFENKEGLSHAQSYNRMWEEPANEPFRLFTEFDFLPHLSLGEGLWTGKALLESMGTDAVGVKYYTRNPRNNHLREHPGFAGGWFVLFDTGRARLRLRFEGEPDPCNQLPQAIDMHLESGRNCWPVHYGVDYPSFGVHLFWSRHLHDPPDTNISGFRLGTVQELHDRAVSTWIVRQPLEFRELLIAMHGEDICFAKKSFPSR
jgi:hypothetical protein